MEELLPTFASARSMGSIGGRRRRDRPGPTGRRAAASLAWIALLAFLGGVGCSSDPPAASSADGREASAADDPEALSGGAAAGAPRTPAPPPVVPATGGPNLVVNGSFEADGRNTTTIQGWQTSGPEKFTSSVGRHGPDKDGDFHLTEWKRAGPFQATTSQTISGVAPGRYVAWAWVRSGGRLESVTFSVKGTGRPDSSTNMIQGDTADWTLVKLPPFEVASGTATLVIRSQGQALAWVYVDDVHFHLAG